MSLSLGEIYRDSINIDHIFVITRFFPFCENIIFFRKKMNQSRHVCYSQPKLDLSVVCSIGQYEIDDFRQKNIITNFHAHHNSERLKKRTTQWKASDAWTFICSRQTFELLRFSIKFIQLKWWWSFIRKLNLNSWNVWAVIFWCSIRLMRELMIF